MVTYVERVEVLTLSSQTDQMAYVDDLIHTRSVPKVMRMILKKIIEHACNYSLSPFKVGSLRLNTEIPALLPLFITVEEVFT